MRIGIFGGTFDPVHYGHLIIAEQSREQAELDQVWFLLSARPPHKTERPVTSFERRFEMLSFAIAGQEHKFRIETIENDRPGNSYTADTFDVLREQHPNHEWFFILGADSVREFPGWHEPTRILDSAALLAVARPGHALCSAQELATAMAIDPARVRLKHIDIPQIYVSSSDLRRRAHEGRSLLYLVPHAVDVYIREKKLYRD